MSLEWPWLNLRAMQYDIIVADPPWSFDLYSEAGAEKSPQKYYDVMSLDDIKAMRVGDLAAGDCLLLLWTCGWAIATGQAQDVARAWGFNPVTELIWPKMTASGKFRWGPGYRARTMHEPILLCTIGSPKHKPFPSIIPGIAREHSRKPDEFYETVEKHTPKLFRRADLFAIDKRPGWDGWGYGYGLPRGRLTDDGESQQQNSASTEACVNADTTALADPGSAVGSVTGINQCQLLI